MKIRIIGGSGSGKSFLAEKLSQKLGIAHYDLDDILWDNAAAQYGTKNAPERRDTLLRGVLEKDEWIIEGAYYSWCKESFEAADRIYYLRTPLRICNARVLRRFVRRKLGAERGKRETVKSLFLLLKWMEKYENESVPEIEKLLEKYGSKVAVLRGMERKEDKL